MVPAAVEKQPCEVCGDLEPRQWGTDSTGRPVTWAGGWAECPKCGGVWRFCSWMSYDEKTGRWVGGGAPDWVGRARK